MLPTQMVVSLIAREHSTFIRASTVPIPNTEVKPAGADGAARVIPTRRDGRVGSRRDYLEKPAR